MADPPRRPPRRTQPIPAYGYPQVFLVDQGLPEESSLDRGPIPTWSVLPPPAKHHKRSGCAGWWPLLALIQIVTLLALGAGAYYIYWLRHELLEMRSTAAAAAEKTPVQYKHIGLPEPTAEKTEKSKTAHLTVKNITVGSRMLVWESAARGAFTEGVEYRDHSLLINETAHYFVYSSVFFRSQGCPGPKPVEHSVYRKTLRSVEPRLLLQSRKLSQCVGGSRWYSNSYLGAVVKLDRMDRVYVHVSDPALVSLEPATTYFGLYKV
ncbi:tumor necrosis factor ligand superfamily member 6 [Polypterus senegalus]|uniref:tumor necrosis factor ligand superfamily member 6 n=1 Tax=Polypterus senegalus TaxID=55291 RepID=UPI001964CDEB|nr:tumor necrosis factor ligand superfamily member 6 [Polypterus senegalus]